MSLLKAIQEIAKMRDATEQDANTQQTRTQHERTVDSAQVAAYNYALTKIAEGVRGLRKDVERDGNDAKGEGLGAQFGNGYQIALRINLRKIPTNEQLDEALKEEK